MNVHTFGAVLFGICLISEQLIVQKGIVRVASTDKGLVTHDRKKKGCILFFKNKLES